MERDPIRFLIDELEGLLDQTRSVLASLLGAEPEGLAFVPNATTGVATVLGSRSFSAGDEILITDHGYAACRSVVERCAERQGARVVVAQVPFPCPSEASVVDAVLARVSDRTRIALLDHVTSPTALVFPIAELVQRLQARGVDVLVDGAHAAGMLPLSLNQLGAAYYTTNLHKWCCAPKGAAVLYTRSDRRAGLEPFVASHGRSSPRTDRSRYLLEFDWTGTQDPTSWLCIPAALSCLAGLVPGGHEGLMQRNHELSVAAGKLVADQLGISLPCPESMLGSMVALPLPEGNLTAAAATLHSELYERYRIQIPVQAFPGPTSRVVRLSAHAYNSLPQYQQLARALLVLL